MAAATPAAPAAPPPTPAKAQKEPQTLKPLYFVGLCLLVVVAITACCVGIAGMVVLMDAEGTGYLSKTTFGHLYKQLTKTNPFFTAMFVNGGGLGEFGL